MRLFVALDVPPPLRSRLADLAGGLPGARWTPVEQLHVTLCFLDEVDGVRAADVEADLASVRSQPFEATLDGLGHFPLRGEPRVLWAGVKGGDRLLALQRAVARACERAGCEIEQRKFHPHITLARLRETPPRRLAEYLAMHSGFWSEPFEVREMTLYSSVRGATGATHRAERIYELA